MSPYLTYHDVNSNEVYIAPRNLKNETFGLIFKHCVIRTKIMKTNQIFIGSVMHTC